MAGHRPRKGWTIAASVCGAMESLSRALAVELAPLRINLVCPGLVKTELWDSMPEADRQAMYERAGRSLPVGRAGEAGDLAQAHLYLMWWRGHRVIIRPVRARSGCRFST
jgi:NAD(P)-dependent dehydrogenase (short-subunit alcohol dehydrogenase family)